MKKIIAVLALTAVLLSAAACSSGNSNSTTQPSTTTQTENNSLSSEDYAKIVLDARNDDDESNITGRNEKGELYRTFEGYKYEMNDEDRVYFAFEGVLKYLEDTYSITIDPTEKYEIAEKATKDLKDKTDAEKTEISNAAILEHYQKIAKVTLTDAQIKEIGDKEIAAQLEDSEKRANEQLYTELEVGGFKNEDIKNFAYSISLINTRAYGIAVIMPAEGKTEDIKAACEAFVETQKKSFETYLVDQFEVAKQAKVEVLDSGEVVMVMCENSDDVFAKISEAIKK